MFARLSISYLFTFGVVLCFWGLLWCLDHYVCYDPYGYFILFWVCFRHLHYYVYVWPSRLSRPFCVFWHRFACKTPFEFDIHYVYVWPSRLSRPFCVFWHRFACKTPFEFDIAFAVFIPLRVCVWPFGFFYPFEFIYPFGPFGRPYSRRVVIYISVLFSIIFTKPLAVSYRHLCWIVWCINQVTVNAV